jgi:hypothetical protein
VSFVAAVLTLSVTVSASSLTVFAMICLLQKLSWGLPHDQSRLLWLKVFPRLDHLRRKDCHPKVSYLVGWRVGPKLGASPPVVTLPPACELCVLATGAILIGFIECSSCLVPDKSPAQGGREFATVIASGRCIASATVARGDSVLGARSLMQSPISSWSPRIRNRDTAL